jgi:hypothetical protein
MTLGFSPARQPSVLGSRGVLRQLQAPGFAPRPRSRAIHRRCTHGRVVCIDVPESDCPGWDLTRLLPAPRCVCASGGPAASATLIMCLASVLTCACSIARFALFTPRRQFPEEVSRHPSGACVYRAPSAGRRGTPCRVKVRWLPRARAHRAAARRRR